MGQATAVSRGKMICPNCKTEYRDGFNICADCSICLVNELPLVENSDHNVAAQFEQEKIFETGDSYEFLDASNILKSAGIPFTSDEFYTGEFRPTRRAQAPYVWAILVPAEKREEALRLLNKKTLGTAYITTQDAEEAMKPSLAWLALAAIAAIVIFMVTFIWTL